MGSNVLKQHYENFEYIWETDEGGVEFIYARDLQKVLGYQEWRKFQTPIEKAKESCKANGHSVCDHFVHVDKMVKTGSSAVREIEDIKLTRYAGYLIAMNGDPRKSEIAFAQNYFAVQTRKFERIIERMQEMERLETREKHRESEKEFGSVIYERGVDSKGFALVKSEGDKAFFGGLNTKAMKERLQIPEKKTLADYTHSAINLGRALANTITTAKVKEDALYGVHDITKEHVKSNTNVRKALTDSGIYPEKLPPEEDIKKIERKIKTEEKVLAKHPKEKAIKHKK